MKSDGQHHLCCAECGEYVNSSEAGAHRCARPAKANTEPMDLGRALEIVLELAKSAIAVPAVPLPADKHVVSTAMDIVEDFIVNHFEEDDEAECLTRHERLSALFDAMERHGNAEGTETQLGDAGEFLRLAFDTMSPSQQVEFLDSQAVSEFIAREDGEEEQDEPTL